MGPSDRLQGADGVLFEEDGVALDQERVLLYLPERAPPYDVHEGVVEGEAHHLHYRGIRHEEWHLVFKPPVPVTPQALQADPRKGEDDGRDDGDPQEQRAPEDHGQDDGPRYRYEGSHEGKEDGPADELVRAGGDARLRYVLPEPDGAALRGVREPPVGRDELGGVALPDPRDRGPLPHDEGYVRFERLPPVVAQVHHAPHPDPYAAAQQQVCRELAICDGSGNERGVRKVR